MANAFSAGFFITIAFIHIIPEQMHKYTELMEEEEKEHELEKSAKKAVVKANVVANVTKASVSKVNVTA